MPQPSLPAATIAAIASRIGSISGCELLQRIQTKPSRAKPGHVEHDLNVIGWSPSLHRIDMQWTVETIPTFSADEQTGHVIGQISRFLAIQEERSRAGVRLDTAWPFATSYTKPTEIDHLHVDKMALIMTITPRSSEEIGKRIGKSSSQIRSQNGTRFENSISELTFALDSLHQNLTEVSGARSLTWTGITVREVDEMRVLDATITFPDEHSTDEPVRMKGPVITIPKTVPETLLLGLAGRPLSSLVNIHPCMDERTIAAARISAGRTIVQIEPDYVKIGDYSQMTVDDALDALMSKISKRQAA